MPLRIDAHHHLWRLDRGNPGRLDRGNPGRLDRDHPGRLDRGYGWLDAPPLAPIRRDFAVTDLRAATAAAGVDRTVLVEAGRQARSEVVEFLAMAEATELIAGVVGWADPVAPDLADVLAGHRAGPGGRWLVGIRSQVQGEPDPDYLRRPDVQAGLATVAAAGLAFDLVVRADQLPAAAVAAAAVPGCRFVLDHLGKPPIAAGDHAQWRAWLAPLARCPNVTAKLSGLVTEARWDTWTVADLRPYVLTALDLFGPGRLMFGSDWPVCLLAATYPRVVAALAEILAMAGLDPAEHREIWGGTAARTYRLVDTG